MPDPLTSVLRHDRMVVLTSLAVVIALAWLWLLYGAALPMPSMSMSGGMAMPMASAWSPGYAALIFVMWAIMMVAMMLPSAAPVILLVSAIERRRVADTPGRAVTLRAGAFAAGYLIVWIGFSAAATALQWKLDRAGLLSDRMASASTVLAGALLIAAGIYQWSPLKRACLAHCRSPIDFLMRHWRSTGWGPTLSGMRHGLFCLGCCWLMMVLLFVGGLMNVAWIAALALLVFIEKVLPWGGRIGVVIGGVFVLWGAAVLAGAVAVA